MGATPSSVTANTAASFGEGASVASSVSSESSATQALAPAITAEIGVTIAYTPGVGEQTGDNLAPLSVSEALSLPVFTPAVAQVAEMAQEFASRDTIQLQDVRAELLRLSVDQPNSEVPPEETVISEEQPTEIQAPPVLDLSHNDEGMSEGIEEALGTRRRNFNTERLTEQENPTGEENSEVGSEENVGLETNENSAHVDEDSETRDESVQDADVAEEDASEDTQTDPEVEPEEPQRKPDEELPPPPMDYSLDIFTANARIQEMIGNVQDVEEHTGRRATGAEAVATINVADAPSALVSGALQVLPLPGQLIPKIDMSLAGAVDTIGSMSEVTAGSITSTVYANKPIKTGYGEPVNQLDVDRVLGPGASLRRAA